MLDLEDCERHRDRNERRDGSGNRQWKNCEGEERRGKVKMNKESAVLELPEKKRRITTAKKSLRAGR